MYSTEVEILVSGKPVKKYAHNGSTYVQANKGSGYSIRVRNNSSKRRLFVVSVDGINVVDGKSAGSTEMGYVINGYSAYEIKGFRTSNDEVHPFKFADKQKSYAAKSDEAGVTVQNCGAIGVEVYDEKVKPQVITEHVHHYHKEYIVPSIWPTYPTRPTYGDGVGTYHLSSAGGNLANENMHATFTCSSNTLGGKGMNAGPITRSASNLDNSQARRINADSAFQCLNFCSTSFDAPQQDTVAFDAGTEFSKEAVTDIVHEVDFETGTLVTTIEIFYAYRQNLIAMGVNLNKEAQVTRPQAFPSKFCKQPRD